MQVVEYYFGFHRKAPLSEVWDGTSDWLAPLGHVEAWGYTKDNTWFFFNPSRFRSDLIFTHHHDEVEKLLATRFTVCEEIYRIENTTKFTLPIHFAMNCVTQCAGLVGIRAFTLGGFRRKLLQNNAEVIHGRPKGKSSGRKVKKPGTQDFAA